MHVRVHLRPLLPKFRNGPPLWTRCAPRRGAHHRQGEKLGTRPLRSAPRRRMWRQTAQRGLGAGQRLGARRAFSSVSKGHVGDPGHWVGAPSSAFVEKLQFFHPHVHDLPATMPTFRLIDDAGVPLPGAVLPDLDKDTCVAMQETMVRVNEFDRVFYDAQRQGRLSFYFTNRGEEAQAVGSAAALAPEDWVWPQYRELGVIFWRGYTMEECANRTPTPTPARAASAPAPRLSPRARDVLARRVLPQ